MKQNIWIAISIINVLLIIFLWSSIRQHDADLMKISSDFDKYQLRIEREFVDLRRSYGDLTDRYNDLMDRLVYLESLKASGSATVFDVYENENREVLSNAENVYQNEPKYNRFPETYKNDFCKKAHESGLLLAGLGFAGLVAKKCDW